MAEFLTNENTKILNPNNFKCQLYPPQATILSAMVDLENETNETNETGVKPKSNFALDVIEHIEDDNKAVKDIYELLPKGGYLVATVPAYQWLWSQHDITHMHYRRYNLGNFTNLLKSNNFHINYSSYFNTLLFPAVVTKRYLDKLTNKVNHDPVDKVSDSMNKLLKSIFDKEKSLIPNIKLPFGLSIIVVAQKL